jgi:hypothetical protein
MNPEEQNETLQKIISLILKANPGNWSKIHIRYSGLVDIGTSDTIKEMGNGESEKAELPADVGFLYNDLRNGMYQSEKGTWYNAHTTIDPSGESETSFDYDNPPEFQHPVGAGSFLQDNRYLPRSSQEAPEWLVEKIREALILERSEAEQD